MLESSTYIKIHNIFSFVLNVYTIYQFAYSFSDPSNGVVCPYKDQCTVLLPNRIIQLN